MSVRRAKASFFSGCNSHLATVAPASSNRSGEAGGSPKPSMERTVQRFREQAGRNARERREGLETHNAGADPADIWGRPPSSIPEEQPDPIDGPAGVVATACLHREDERNTG